MKKSIIININGVTLSIDEDAYEKLSGYIVALNNYFASRPSGKEIINDIEARIAELLQPRISPSKQSISVEDIAEIIEILGSPEDIAGAEDESFHEGPKDTSQSESKTRVRRLYRDRDHAMIAGVCSGMAAYFRIDPIIFRLLFFALIFAGGISVILYIVLWIAVPMARTTSQKLEMHGEEVNLNNIERKIREEYSMVKDNISRIEIKPFWARMKVIFNPVIQLFRVLFGIFLILLGLSIIVGLVASFYLNGFVIHEAMGEPYFSLQDFLYSIYPHDMANLALIMGVLVVVLPVSAMMYAGLKLLMRIKAQDKWVMLSLALVWIVSVIFLSALIFNGVNQFRTESDYTETIPLTDPPKGTVYLLSMQNFSNNESLRYRVSHSNSFGFRKSDKGLEIIGKVRVDIQKSESGKPYIEIYREAHSSTADMAMSAARKVKVNFQKSDSAIKVDPFFQLSNEEQWNFQEAKFIVNLPVGTKIYIDETLKYFLSNVQNLNDYWDRDMAGKTWLMTENGLELIGYSTSDAFTVKSFGNRTLYVRASDKLPENTEYYSDGFRSATIGNSRYLYKRIELFFKNTISDSCSVDVIKFSAGNNPNNAYSSVKSMQYSFVQNDSILLLDPFFLLPVNTSLVGQNVKVVVNLPEKTKVFISRKFEPMLDRYENSIRNWNLTDQTLYMTSEGLREEQYFQN